MNNLKNVQLEAPGSGLPLIEMLYLKGIIKPYIVFFIDSRKAKQYFNYSSAEFLKNLNGIDESKLRQKVLVERPHFIEDSSRNWSIALLCRHLSKVNNGVAGFICKKATFLEANLPSAKERLTSVKPEEENNSVSELENIIESIENFKKVVGDLDDKALRGNKVHHPWLGELNHYEWIWFCGFHFKIHLKQLNKIKLKLSEGE